MRRTEPSRSTRTPSRKPRKSRATSRTNAPQEIPHDLHPIVRALSKEHGVSVEKGWGSANISLKVRGKIFAMTIGGDLVLKLPKESIDELVEQRRGTRFDPRKNGRVMKEW